MLTGRKGLNFQEFSKTANFDGVITISNVNVITLGDMGALSNGNEIFLGHLGNGSGSPNSFPTN